MNSLMLRQLLLFMGLMLFFGCGYKPSSHTAKVVMKETISTEVVISMEDPESAVLIKDTLNEAIIRRFHASLRDRSNAQSHLKIRLKSVLFTPMKYDVNGYITAYRAKITLSILRTTDEINKAYKAYGTYDFALEPNAIISDFARLEAIKFGSIKALDSFVAQISAEGMRENRK